MLDKKVALVTGASRGIGREIALTLAAQGNFVVVNYNGSEARAKEVVETIEKNGGQGAVYQCSVGDFNACQEMIQSIIKEYGRLDILVNNAGITRDNLIMRMKEEDFDAVINTNLKGAFNTIRLWKVIPTLISGLAMGYLYVRFGVHASIVFHFIVDYMAVLASGSTALLVSAILMVIIISGIPALIEIGRKMLRAPEAVKGMPNIIPPDQESIFSRRD